MRKGMRETFPWPALQDFPNSVTAEPVFIMGRLCRLCFFHQVHAVLWRDPLVPCSTVWGVSQGLSAIGH